MWQFCGMNVPNTVSGTGDGVPPTATQAGAFTALAAVVAVFTLVVVLGAALVAVVAAALPALRAAAMSPADALRS